MHFIRNGLAECVGMGYCLTDLGSSLNIYSHRFIIIFGEGWKVLIGATMFPWKRKDLPCFDGEIHCRSWGKPSALQIRDQILLTYGVVGNHILCPFFPRRPYNTTCLDIITLGKPVVTSRASTT